MTSTKLSTIALAALLLALGACGKKDAAQPGEQAAATVAADGANNMRTANGLELDEYGSILLPRQPVLALQRYTVLNQSEKFRTNGQAETTQVENLYRQFFWSGNARDHELLGYDFLPEVRMEKDAFKRADIVKAKGAELDAAWAEAQKQKHYAVYVDGVMSIEPYDAQKKGYMVHSGIAKGDTYGWSKPKEHAHNAHATWMIAFAGSRLPRDISWYIPQDEAEARRIESVLSTLRSNPTEPVSLPGYFLGHVADTPTRPNKLHYAALLVTDGVTVVDPANRQPLFTVNFQAIEPKAKIDDGDLRRALQPEPKPAS